MNKTFPWRCLVLLGLGIATAAPAKQSESEAARQGLQALAAWLQAGLQASDEASISAELRKIEQQAGQQCTVEQLRAEQNRNCKETPERYYYCRQATRPAPNVDRCKKWIYLTGQQDLRSTYSPRVLATRLQSHPTHIDYYGPSDLRLRLPQGLDLNLNGDFVFARGQDSSLAIAESLHRDQPCAESDRPLVHERGRFKRGPYELVVERGDDAYCDVPPGDGYAGACYFAIEQSDDGLPFFVLGKFMKTYQRLRVQLRTERYCIQVSAPDTEPWQATMASIKLGDQQPLGEVKLVPLASYDCDAAKTVAERAICGSPELAKLDRRLGAIYQQVQENQTSEWVAELRRRQRLWLKERDTACKGESPPPCLTRAIEQRIELLQSVVREPQRINEL